MQQKSKDDSFTHEPFFLFFVTTTAAPSPVLFCFLKSAYTSDFIEGHTLDHVLMTSKGSYFHLFIYLCIWTLIVPKV